MTRLEVFEKYVVSEGRIWSPGKFEGQPVYVPYFYDAYLNGMVDFETGPVLGFRVDDTDLKEFPELRGKKVVSLILMDEGFVRERAG